MQLRKTEEAKAKARGRLCVCIPVAARDACKRRREVTVAEARPREWRTSFSASLQQAIGDLFSGLGVLVDAFFGLRVTDYGWGLFLGRAANCHVMVRERVRIRVIGLASYPGKNRSDI